MGIAIPVWFAEKSSLLASSTPRHKWMSDQLLERRRLQAHPRRALDSLRSHVALAIGADLEATRVFEVLSDGLGYVEPSWHAVEYSQVCPGGSSEVDVGRLREEIRTRRRENEGDLGGVKTQRAIGGRLYESGLFLVTPTTSFFLADRRWEQVGASNLPLKFPADTPTRDATKESTDIDASLILLSTKVLWPGFFKDDPGHYFSLVFLHASLWQSASGVWAFHVRSDKPLAAPEVKSESALRSLVDPAVRCLEDVVGWANEHEGTQARRRGNVDLFFRATGREKPKWTEDGVHGTFDARDRQVYEVAPSPAGAEDVRRVLDLAIAVLADRSDVPRPTTEPDTMTRAVMRSIEALFIAGRLEEQPSDHSFGGHLPPLAEILRGYAAQERVMPRSHDRATPAQAPEITLCVAQRIAGMTQNDWKPWCSVALRATCLAGFAGPALFERAMQNPVIDDFLGDLL